MNKIFFNKLFSKKNILLSSFIITTLSLLVSITAVSAQITDDEFARMELFPRETRSAEESIKTDSIDVERDLSLSEIESLFILLAILFGLVILISVLSAMKKISTLILVVGLIGVFLAAALIGFEMFMRSGFLGDIYSSADYLWEDIGLDEFMRRELTDIPHSYSIEIDPLRLSNIFSVSDSYLRAIDKALSDIWQSDEYHRESIMIEFNTRNDANNFVNQIFIEENKIGLRRGSYSQGIFRTEEERYRRGFLMVDNRFVFLSFSEEPFSDNFFSYMMESYPEQYMVSDNRPPTIDIVSPKITNINEIVFKVSDRESGLNQLSISVLNAKFNPVDDCIRNNNVRYDEFICKARELQEGRNNFVIIASDRERNNVKMDVEYVLDTERPIIEISSRTTNKVIARITDNHGIERDEIIAKTNNGDLSGRRYCNLVSSSFLCEFPIQGETMKIKATDKAGNRAEKEVEIDFTIPIINFINPRDEYTNSKELEFFISDEKSGLRTVNVEINGARVNICSVVDSRRQRCRYELKENENIIKVIAEDNSGNFLEYEKEFLFDESLPSITIISNSNDALEFYIRDEISGINTEWVFVNGGTFLVEDLCIRENVGFRCTYNIRTQDNEARIRISDNARNINEIREPLNS